jgi:CARDB protein
VGVAALPFRRIAVPILISCVAAVVSAAPAGATPPPEPDLTVTDASFIVRTVDAGGQLVVKATIENIGKKVAKDFLVAIEFRGHKLAPGSHIDLLAAHSTATIRVHGEVNRSELPGGAPAKVCADAFNTVDEGDHEGNNCKRVGIALVNGLLFYKVVSATATENSGGTIDCWKVTLDGPVKLKFQRSPESFDWSFRVVGNTIKLATDGPVFGDILMPDGRQVGQGGQCGTVTLPLQGLTEPGGFTAFLRPLADAEGIKVSWPDIGTVDTLGILDCQVATPFSKAQLITEVPWNKLDSTDPFTLPLNANVDVKNNGGNCPNHYEYSVELQRVSETGHPL